MRCVVFELAGGGTYVPPPPGRAKVAQTPDRARVKVYQAMSIMTHGLTSDDLSQGQVNLV